MEEIRMVLLVSAILLFAIVFYRWLLRYLRKDSINVKFSYLFPFEKEMLSGREKIKVDVSESQNVRAEIAATSDGELIHLAFEGHMQEGISEMDLDLEQVENGDYNLRIIFPDQIITRYIRIQND